MNFFACFFGEKSQDDFQEPTPYITREPESKTTMLDYETEVMSRHMKAKTGRPVCKMPLLSLLLLQFRGCSTLLVAEVVVTWLALHIEDNPAIRWVWRICYGRARYLTLHLADLSSEDHTERSRDYITASRSQSRKTCESIIGYRDPAELQP